MSGTRLPWRLLAAQTASLAGSSAYLTGALWVSAGTGEGNGWVAALIAASFLPGLVLSPLLGWAVDRWPRRSLAAGSDAVRAAVLIGCAATSLSPPAALVVLALALASLDELHEPAFSALLRDRTPKRHYARVLAGLQVSTQLGWMAGALLGGAALAWLDLRAALLINAASFVVSAALTWSAKPVRVSEEGDPGPVSPGPIDPGPSSVVSTDAVQQRRRDAPRLISRIWPTAGLLAVLGAALQGSNLLLPGYVGHALEAGPLTFGTLDALYALGALGGAVWLGRVRQTRRAPDTGADTGGLRTGLLGAALSLTLLGSLALLPGGAPAAWPAGVALAGLGLSLSVRITLWARLQRLIPSGVQGRVHAAINAAISLSALTSLALGAGLSRPASAPAGYLILGAAVAGLGLWLAHLQVQREAAHSAQQQTRGKKKKRKAAGEGDRAGQEET